MNTAQLNTVNKMLAVLRQHTQYFEAREAMPAELQEVWAILQHQKETEESRVTVSLGVFKAASWYCEESVIKSVCPDPERNQTWITGCSRMGCAELDLTVLVNWSAVTSEGCFQAIGLAQDIESSKIFYLGDNEIVGEDGEELGDHYIYQELMRFFADWKTGAIEAVNEKLLEIKDGGN